MRKEFMEETLNCEGKDACNWIIVEHQVEHCGTCEEQLEQYFKGKIISPMQSTLWNPVCNGKSHMKNEKLIRFRFWLCLLLLCELLLSLLKSQVFLFTQDPFLKNKKSIPHPNLLLSWFCSYIFLWSGLFFLPTCLFQCHLFC